MSSRLPVYGQRVARWRMSSRSLVQAAFHAVGLDIRRYEGFGNSAFADIHRLLRQRHPVVFDVGANVGQTIRRVRRFWPGAFVHSFEPSKGPYAELQQVFGTTPRVVLNEMALGAAVGERTLLENESSDMTSFLRLGPDGWGASAAEVVVPVTTVDSYCAENGIQRIDVLKIDTQGFELEVLRGAENALAEHKVRFLLAEVSFAALYEDAPTFNDLTTFAEAHSLVLVSLYGMRYVANRLASLDALFTDEKAI